MDALIRYLVLGLVDKADQVEVRAEEGEGVVTVSLKVAQDEVGKIIGRDGRTVNALRTLLTAAAVKVGKKARLEVLDDRRTGRPAGTDAAEPEAT
ncbi:MAG: KH domain-containing protein [Deltaproteobacteria bacterium]|nr:KH domain-containing protein [Deltaproteobacteria bacterium]